MQPAAAKGYGCLGCPILPTVKGVKIGDDYRGGGDTDEKPCVEHHRVPGWGPAKAKILVIFDHPSLREDAEEDFYSSRDAIAVEGGLKEAGIRIKEDVRFCYAARCAASDLTATTYKSCNVYLYREIEAVDPDYIITVGSAALQSIVGKGTRLDSAAGSAFSKEICGKSRIVYPMHTKSSVYFRPHLEVEIERAWINFGKIVENPDKIGQGMGAYEEVTPLRAVKILRGYLAKGTHLKPVDIGYDIETNALHPKNTWIQKFVRETAKGEEKNPVLSEKGRRTKLPQDPSGQRWRPSKVRQKAKMALFSWSDRQGHAYVCYVRHEDRVITKRERKEVLSALYEVLKSLVVRKHIWNATFECTWAQSWGIKIRNFHDAMCTHFQINENDSHQLDQAAAQHTAMGAWGNAIAGYESAVGHNHTCIPPEIETPYSGADSDSVLRLGLLLPGMLDSARMRIVDHFYPKIIQVIAGMQLIGAKADEKFLSRYEEYTRLFMEKSKESLNNIAEVRKFVRVQRREREDPEFEFNPKSPPQVQEILYGKSYLNRSSGDDSDMDFADALERDGDDEVELGSTDKDSLQQLVRVHKCPFAQAMLDYRKYETQHTRYAVSLKEQTDAHDGYIYGSFKVTGTKTGRLCVSAETLIDTANGPVRIDELVAGSFVRTHRMRYRRVQAVFTKGVEPMIRLRLGDGSSITCTRGHKILTTEGWMSAEQIFRRNANCAEVVHEEVRAHAEPDDSRAENYQRQSKNPARSVVPNARSTVVTDGSANLREVWCLSHDHTGNEASLSQEVSEAAGSATVSQLRSVQVREPEWCKGGTRCTASPRSSSCHACRGYSVGFYGETPKNERVVRKTSGGSSDGVRATYQKSKSGYPRIGSCAVLAHCGDPISGYKSGSAEVPAQSGQLLSASIRGAFADVRLYPKYATARGKNVSSSTHPQAHDEGSDLLEYVSGGMLFGIDAMQARYSTRSTVSDCLQKGQGCIRLRIPAGETFGGNRRGSAPQNSPARHSENENGRESGLGSFAIFGFSGSCAAQNGSPQNPRKIVSVEYVGPRVVWDMTVEEDHSYTAQGFISHNSSSGPNLQNQPYPARRIYVSRYGRDGCIVGADFSQIEVRVAAALSGDEHLLEAYFKGEDIHFNTMCRIFGVSKEKAMTWPEDVRKKRRTITKRVVFGVIYGSTGMGVVGTLRADKVFITDEEGDRYVQGFFDAHPQLAKYLKRVHRLMRSSGGYTLSPLGRRRHLPDVLSGVRKLESRAERQGPNSIIQGTASDLTTTAMIIAEDRLRKAKLRAKLFLQVHDNIVIDSPREEAFEAATILLDSMEKVKEYIPEVWGKGVPTDWLIVPVVAEGDIGVNWRDGMKFNPSAKPEKDEKTFSVESSYVDDLMKRTYTVVPVACRASERVQAVRDEEMTNEIARLRAERSTS